MKINIKAAAAIGIAFIILVLFVIALMAEQQKESSTKKEAEEVETVVDPISGELTVENSPGTPQREDFDKDMRAPAILGMYNLVELGLNAFEADTIRYRITKRAQKLNLDKSKIISIAKDNIRIVQDNDSIDTVYLFDVYFDGKLWMKYKITMSGINEGVHTEEEKPL